MFMGWQPINFFSKTKPSLSATFQFISQKSQNAEMKVSKSFQDEMLLPFPSFVINTLY